jgi:hypothetical protein
LRNAGARSGYRWRHERWRLGRQVDIGGKRSTWTKQCSRGENRHSYTGIPHHKFSPEKKSRTTAMANDPSPRRGKLWTGGSSVTRLCGGDVVT